MRKILKYNLKKLSQLILKKYHPVVVGISGSIGKTSARDAVYAVLKDRLAVRVSQKNYNNELGLPLTIIGADSAGRNIFGWLKIFAQACQIILSKDQNYPQVLILEMGVDHPGDMTYLTSIVQPTVGLITAVSYSHLEFFGTIANIKKEKQKLIENLNNKGLAVLNYDNELTREMSEASKARVLTFGLKEGADLRAQDIIFNFTRGNYELSGVNFKLNYQGSIVPVFMDNIMTETALYAALAGAAVGLYFDMNLVEIGQALSNFSLPKGRMSVLPGIKHSFIIDDSYNASPDAVLSALDILGRIKVDEGANKYAILGDMLELGDYTAEGHYRVGTKVAESGVNQLIAVGEKSCDIIRGASEAGLADDYIFHFDKSLEVGKFLRNRIKAGDVILVKGSQGMRMEKIVKDIMAEPARAAELLVRQSKEWQ